MAWNSPESFVLEGFDRLRGDWEMRHDYQGGKVSRFRRQRAGVGVIPRHADYHYRLEIEWFRAMEFFRDFDRNDPIVGPAITRLVNNVIMSGITPDAATPDAGLNKELNDWWSEYAADPDQVDLQGEAAWHEMEEDALRAMVVDGDICALPMRRDGTLELMEAHRLRTPLKSQHNVVHGVELDDRRRRIAYNFTGEDVNPLSVGLRIGDVTRIPVRDRDGDRQIFHLYKRKRISQTRGVSYMNPICDIAGMWDDVNFATLVKAQVAACWAILKEYPANAPPIPGQARAGALTQESQQDGSLRTTEGMQPGMMFEGKPGQKLTGFAPNIPNPEFFPHSIMLLGIIAHNLGIPLAVLLLDPKQAGNFSSLRGVMDQAKIGFTAVQWVLIRKWHRPVREWRLRWEAGRNPSFARAMRKGGREFFACKWRRPRHPYLEPVTDRAARLLGTRNLLNSPRQGAAEDGFEWEEIIQETVQDNSLAICSALKEARKINSRFPGCGVSWRDVLSLPTPDRVNVSMSAVLDQGGNDAETGGGNDAGTRGRGDAETGLETAAVAAPAIVGLNGHARLPSTN